MKEKIGVLALQGDVKNHLRMIEKIGVVGQPVRTAQELKNSQGLIIPGGESTTISKLATIFELRSPIQEAISEGLPVYGSCAGMIMLAENIIAEENSSQEKVDPFRGFEMTVKRNAFGRQNESFESHLSVNKISNSHTPFPAIFIRAPWATAVSENIKVLANIEDLSQNSGTLKKEYTTKENERIKEKKLENPGLVLRQANMLATSFHPELTDDTRIHELFLSILRKEA